jgi:aminoglycoside phosphotransferase (APT) family kinase protein
MFSISCHQPVICNGDIWVNNLIFTKDTSSGVIGDELCAIIDWQMAHLGSCVEDLSVLLAWALAPQSRRMHANDMLQYYVQRLEEYCKRAGVICPFNSNDVRAIYDAMRPFTLAANIMLVPFLLSNAKDAQDPIRRQFLLDTTFGLLEDIAINSNKS